MAEPMTNPGTDYERSDVALRPIAYVAIGVLAVLTAGPLMLHFVAEYPEDASRAPTIAPPLPRLQTAATGDLAAYRAAEDKKLNSYGWIDRKKGIVHIPIAEAMARLAAHGIDGFPKGAP